MARSPISTTLDTSHPADGLLMVTAESGAWQALRDLHGAMAELRGRGLAPELSYVYAMAREGELVDGRDVDADVFIVGYRLANPN